MRSTVFAILLDWSSIRAAAGVTLDRAGPAHVLQLACFVLAERQFADGAEILVQRALGVRPRRDVPAAAMVAAPLPGVAVAADRPPPRVQNSGVLSISSAPNCFR